MSSCMFGLHILVHIIEGPLSLGKLIITPKLQ